MNSESPSGAPRPPACVVGFARCHWLTGITILVATGGMRWLLGQIPGVAVSRTGYAVLIGLGLLYLLTGTLVWRGFRIGRGLNFLCSLPYLARPSLGLRLWREMKNPEFRNFFQGGRRNQEL